MVQIDAPPAKVDAYARTVRQLLSGARYSVDYYQRDYKWETKQVAELLDDLTSKFFESYEHGHERSEVEQYGHYFLGSIIISEKAGRKYIIDGQQRLTTLTILLIHLDRLQGTPAKATVSDLIFSEKFGSRSFNLDVDERNECMEALFSGAAFDATNAPESVRTLVARYSDIEELLSDELNDDALPFFIDWLIENVRLVEITAYSDEDAYTIFETMNDRGLSLSPADMLKGYLLANISDVPMRDGATRTWKHLTERLISLGKDEDADAIKAWLRSQYASSIRERKRGALPQDFDRIGTEFHRWVRDSRENLHLSKSGDFADFIRTDLNFYANRYFELREAATQLTRGLETVLYNAQLNFTLQYPVLLAPLRPADSGDEIAAKLRIVGAYLDILISRRIWNFRAIDYSTMQYAMFLVMRDIRGKEPADLAQILRSRLDAEPETFGSNERFHLHGQNRRQIHRLLARMTDYVETESGFPSHYIDYVGTGRKAFEVEHIWADHFERHTDEFDHPADFSAYRNRIGGLLLLPKSFNSSFGDLPYEEKLEHYDSQNLLARSLNERCYERNPGFRQFLERSQLPFRSHSEFHRSDLDDRQRLYIQLAERVWNAERVSVGPQA